MNLRKIRINDSDIFLENFEKEGHGKITISNSWGYNFSYEWGSMGCCLEDFILSINEGYFISQSPPPEGGGLSREA